MSGKSSDRSEKGSAHSGLYTPNDYIRDLMAVIEDNKYCIQHLNEVNQEFERKIEFLQITNRELLLKDQQNKQIQSNLRESITGLKKYINKLELELKIGTKKTNEDIVLYATEKSVKHNDIPSKVVLQNTITNKSFVINCEQKSGHTLIDIQELNPKTNISKLAALVIQWKLLPLFETDGQKVDITEWRIKDNTILNLISLEDFPDLRPNSGHVMKTTFNHVTDFQGFESDAIYPSMASKTSKELDNQLKELEKYLQLANISDDETTISATNSKNISEEPQTKEQTVRRGHDFGQLVTSIPLFEDFLSQKQWLESNGTQNMIQELNDKENERGNDFISTDEAFDDFHQKVFDY